MNSLGDPQDAQPCILVAGSKGKGSVAMMMQRGLQAAGHRTGLYSSPHLSDWRERIQIEGEIPPDVAFEYGLERVLAKSQGTETFFDLLTATAFVMFARQDCEMAVVEVGLGGRFDSTNVVWPKASVVTSIELEHTEVLGSTLAAIASEKAGIFHPGGRCWGGCDLAPEAEEVLRRAATDCAEDLLRPHPAPPRLLPWPQEHMRANFDLAWSVLQELEPSFGGAAAALAELPSAQLELPGRFERRWLGDGREVVFDTAHTAQSLAAALRGWRSRYYEGSRGVLLALREEKDPNALAQALWACAGPPSAAETWWVTRAGDHPRSADPRDLAPAFAATVLDPLAFPESTGPLLVTGSTYLVGALRPLTLPAPTAQPTPFP